jgi:spore coat polysaccharide biosynthesis protein SpsF
MDLGGATVLSRVISRIQRCQYINEVVVATSTSPADDAIVSESRRQGVKAFRGSEQDVLDRFYHVAQDLRSDVVVRITSDCPLIDPEVSDRTIRSFLDGQPDYASNALQRTYPRGLDTEVMKFEALESAWHNATEPYQREHVTPYLYENPKRYRLRSVTQEKDQSEYRWTLDTVEDLEFLRAVYARLDSTGDFSWRDVLQLIDRDPSLSQINKHVKQKEVRSQ